MGTVCDVIGVDMELVQWRFRSRSSLDILRARRLQLQSFISTSTCRPKKHIKIGQRMEHTYARPTGLVSFHPQLPEASLSSSLGFS